MLSLLLVLNEKKKSDVLKINNFHEKTNCGIDNENNPKVNKNKTAVLIKRSKHNK